jgi:hypothetical protein
MLDIKGKTIIYTTPEGSQLGQVSPYLLVERLVQELEMTWPQMKVNKVFASKKQHSHQVYCALAESYTEEQVRLIKAQIELISARMLVDLQEKIESAKVVR